MNQEFLIGKIKIIQDEQGYGIAIDVSKDEAIAEWEVIATFKYPADAIRYFTELIMTLGAPQQ